MSTTALSSSPLDVRAISTQDLDAEYARRWAAWQVRGRTRDGAVRLRLIDAGTAFLLAS